MAIINEPNDEGYLVGTDGDDELHGSAPDDVLFGGAGNDLMYGGAGRNVYWGGDGVDVVSFGDSDAGVAVDMTYGGHGSGFAQDAYFGGDVEQVRGSQFDDIFYGTNAAWMKFDGSGGHDLVSFKYAFMGVVVDLRPDVPSDPMTYTAAHFTGIEAIEGSEFGDVFYGSAGNDAFIGGGGDDFMYGGEGNDTYTVNTQALVTIQDSGASLGDTLILNVFADAGQVAVTRIGNDAYLHSANDSGAGVPDNGVRLVDWYAGSNTLEHIQTADGQAFSLPVTGDGFALFG